MSAIPESLKRIVPFLRRAQEVEKTNDFRAPLLAYGCRNYAMSLGLEAISKLEFSDKNEAQDYLLGLMNELEASKEKFPECVNGEKCAEGLRSFAQEQLSTAEEEFMAGVADKNTARQFYAAASFFEALGVYSEGKTLPEVDKKQCLFAKYRATNIVHAIKQGKPPVPSEDDLLSLKTNSKSISKKDNNMGDRHDDTEFNVMANSSNHSGNSRSKTNQSNNDHKQCNSMNEEFSALNHENHDEKASKSPSSFRDCSGLVTENQKNDAIELSRFACKALEMEDYVMAVKYLREALSEIGG